MWYFDHFNCKHIRSIVKSYLSTPTSAITLCSFDEELNTVQISKCKKGMIKLFDRKLNVQWSDWVVQYNLFSHFKDTEFCL